eukprot:SAG11_NODE_4002_length_2112_cov_4.740841_2_plen_162_part_00
MLGFILLPPNAELPLAGGTPPFTMSSSADDAVRVCAATWTAVAIVLLHFVFCDGRLALWCVVKRKDAVYLARYADELNEHVTRYSLELDSRGEQAEEDPAIATLPQHHHHHHRKKLAQTRMAHADYDRTRDSAAGNHHRQHGERVTPVTAVTAATAATPLF